MTTIPGTATPGGSTPGSTPSASVATNTAPASGTDALGKLSSNFSDFLKLLMTQLQNQDPSSPMDANQFTSELVQFSSVEQQINTNTSLTQLIQLTQGDQVIQTASFIGKHVTTASDHVPLQNGTATIALNAPTTEPVQISITTEHGTLIRSMQVVGASGGNSVTWDGRNNNGTTVPDGAYRVVATDAAGGAVPFNVVGTATGLTQQNNTVGLKLGALTIPLTAIQAVGN